jgi:simple sugar transport system ATP-binding protein
MNAVAPAYAPAEGAAPLLRIEGLTKRFGALTACDDVSLDLRVGEVLALLGENGAGKSTLMKTLYGVYRSDAGQVLLDGAPVAFGSPRAAMAARIGMVFQTFALIPALSVRDNLALAWPGTPWHLGRRGRHAAGALARLAELAPGLDPGTRVGDLSVAEQQLIELAKVLNLDARIVILDEPTAVLTPAEARRLYRLIRQLADGGMAVVLITHKLADVEATADRYAVLRRGRLVAEGSVNGLDQAALIEAMVGRSDVRPPAPPPAPSHPVPRLVLRGLTASGPQGRIEAVDLAVGRGEIVGVAGVAGNGQTALAEAVAGVLPIAAGDILLDGESIARRPDEKPRPLRLGYVPEEPRRNGVATGLSLLANLGLRALAEGTAAEDAGATAARLAAFDVRPPEPQRLAGTLSGGNLQKLVLARELGEVRPAILLAFPTMGLDVAATGDVYRRMTEAARAGAAILWISEEISDLLALAHRIAVLRDGRVAAVLDNDGTLTRERVGAAMTGAPA